MTGLRRQGVGIAIAAVVALGPPTLPRAGVPAAARDAASAFLDRYVMDDGRVVRSDQGGDTVSEGQAYAMLVTAATGDRARFDRVWQWTREHLERDDGLFSWHWVDGAVADPMPATDADLDIAWALTIAADRFDDASLRDAAARVGTAILDQETVTVGDELVLVAGPWARTAPYTVNPSYFSPVAFDALGRATGDPRWETVRRASRRVLGEVTTSSTLPPDWARMEETGAVRAAAAPTGGGAPAYGLDAARVVVRAASDCDRSWRVVAARAHTVLERHHQLFSGRSLTVEGVPTSPQRTPLMLVAGAAAARAAGDGDVARGLLARAERLDRRHPTYYGGAWVALGRLMLDGALAARCA